MLVNIFRNVQSVRWFLISSPLSLESNLKTLLGVTNSFEQYQIGYNILLASDPPTYYA